MVFQAGFIATWERYTACRCLKISCSYWAESNACKIDLGAMQSFMSLKRDYAKSFQSC